MALEVTYYHGADQITGQIYGAQILRATVTLTGSSASIGARPPGARLARFTAGENCVISNNGRDTSSTNGQFLNAGSVIDLVIPPNGDPYYGQTA